MSPSEDPRELRRLDEDRVRGEHEARQVCRCVWARRGACVVVRVQEPLVRHEEIPSTLAESFRRSFIPASSP
jgi:hypothetical protein